MLQHPVGKFATKKEVAFHILFQNVIFVSLKVEYLKSKIGYNV